MTHTGASSARTSVSGSPRTAIMSAQAPGRSVPILPSIRSSCAFTIVADWMACERRHPGVDVHRKLPAVHAVYLDAGIGAVGELEARSHRLAQARQLHLEHLARLLELVRLVAACRAALDHVLVGVGIHHQPRAVLARELDRLVVEHRCVLDGAHARPDRALDALGAVRVDRDVAPLVGGGRDRRADLVLGVIGHRGIRARRPHAAGREHLDPVRAVLDVLAHLEPYGLGSVGERLVPLDPHVGGQVVVVAMPARRRERLDGDQQARPGDASGGDRIAQRDVGEVTAAEVTRRGEACQQRLARVGNALDRSARRRLREILVRRLLFAAREVHVGVDEARKQGYVTELDIDLLARHPRRDSNDRALVDLDHLVAKHPSGLDLEHPCGRHRQRLRFSARGARKPYKNEKHGPHHRLLRSAGYVQKREF